jgi:cobalt-precorrin 5A hydrolase/precorrin-3B C17-methyltransferase
MESVAGLFAETQVQGLVVIAPLGAVVRALAPCLGDKTRDPAVVCVDSQGRHAIAVVGGHRPGLDANWLAKETARRIAAPAVITTSTLDEQVPPLDGLVGYRVEGEVASVLSALQAGQPVHVENRTEWPLPLGLADRLIAAPGSGPVLVVDDRVGGSFGRRRTPRRDWSGIEGRPDQTDAGAHDGGPCPGVIVSDPPAQPRDASSGSLSGTASAPPLAWLRPPSLVLGLGCSSGAEAEELKELVQATFDLADLSLASVGLAGTVSTRLSEPAIAEVAAWLGLELVTSPVYELTNRPELALVGLSVDLLRQASVPNPSPVVEQAVGAPSVAEAAALSLAGPGGELVVAKKVGPNSTVAVARRRPRGLMTVVGLGPGRPGQRTGEVERALLGSEVVVGYGPYVDMCEDLLKPHQLRWRSQLGQEMERARLALATASAGHRVVLVSSGDAGLYGMAAAAFEAVAELKEPPTCQIEVLPGVSSFQAAAALLGAPGSDHATLNLSDHLVPFDEIEARVEHLARCDITLYLFNPRSSRRTWQLGRVLDRLEQIRGPETLTAVVRQVSRPGQSVIVSKLAELDREGVDMISLVVVLSSRASVLFSQWLAEPRGYTRLA